MSEPDWIASATPFRIEPWQQEILKALASGERPVIMWPAQRSPARQQIERLAQAASLHSALYGCDVELGNDGPVMFIRCARGEDCPKLQAGDTDV